MALPYRDTLYISFDGTLQEAIQSHAALLVLMFTKSNCFNVVNIISGNTPDQNGTAKSISQSVSSDMVGNICKSLQLLSLREPDRYEEQNAKHSPVNTTRNSDADIPEVIEGCRLPVILKASGIVCHCGLSTVIRNLVSLSGKEDGHEGLVDLMGFRQTSLKNCAEASVWTKLVDSSLSGDLMEFMVTKESSSDPSVPLPDSVDLLETKLASPVSTFNINHRQKNWKKPEAPGRSNDGEVQGVTSDYKTDRVVVNKKAYKEAIRAYKRALSRGDLSPNTSFKKSDFFISLDSWRNKMNDSEKEDQNVVNRGVDNEETERTKVGLQLAEARNMAGGQIKQSGVLTPMDRVKGSPESLENRTNIDGKDDEDKACTSDEQSVDDPCGGSRAVPQGNVSPQSGCDNPCSNFSLLPEHGSVLESTNVGGGHSKSGGRQRNIHPDGPSDKNKLHRQSNDNHTVQKNGAVRPPLKHLFVEGPSMTIADLAILFPVHLFLWLCRGRPDLPCLIPHTINWYQRMWSLGEVREAAMSYGLEQVNVEGGDAEVSTADVKIIPPVDYQHGKGKSRKARNHAIKRELPSVLSKLEASIGLPTLEDLTFTTLDWSALPAAVSPQHGEVPEERLLKKHQQIECLVSVVKTLAQDSDTIVDFCSGGGHVGIVLAHLLPACTIYMVENDEESLRRAHQRVRELNLDNVVLYQSNIGYFQKAFNIGVSLHACGVATDIVIDKCLMNKASFVSSPCCYGSINPTDSISYPRSKRFRSIPVITQDYLVVAHAAEQTNWDFSHENSKRGKLCMSVIDEDRSSYIREGGFQVHLTSLQPLTCSPKNNLLIGLSPDRKNCFQLLSSIR